MLRKLLVPALLGVAGVLFVAGDAQAQRRGPSRGGGGWSGSGWGGSGYGGPYRGGANNWWNYIPGAYGNSGYGNYYGPSYGYRYGPPYSTPYYFGNTYPRDSYYYAPAPLVQTQPVADDTASIRVLVPNPDARVWFDGTLTKQAGTERLFATPPLDSNVANNYRVRAIVLRDGREVTEERIVAVAPNAQAIVDFR